MGGDGGVVATNRRYMRGAGSADHTADSGKASAVDIAEAERERLQQMLRTCAITGTVFDFSSSGSSSSGCGNIGAGEGGESGIVACPYGYLYGREAAVKALLRRVQQSRKQGGGEEASTPDIGWHVRGLKDLHPVRFYLAENQSSGRRGRKDKYDANTDGRGDCFIPTCPLSGIELNGLQPVYVIARRCRKEKKSKTDKEQDESLEDKPNVLSEKAIKQMDLNVLQEELGPFQMKDLIRLAPPSGRILDNIRKELKIRREKESKVKKRKKKPIDSDMNKMLEKRRRRVILSEKPKSSEMSISSSGVVGRQGHGGKTIDMVHKNVAAAVASNATLSSLFVNDKKTKRISEKEKNNNLFAR